MRSEQESAELFKVFLLRSKCGEYRRKFLEAMNDTLDFFFFCSKEATILPVRTTFVVGILLWPQVLAPQTVGLFGGGWEEGRKIRNPGRLWPSASSLQPSAIL